MTTCSSSRVNEVGSQGLKYWVPKSVSDLVRWCLRLHQVHQMDHASLSIKKRGNHILANQWLYVKEAKSGQKENKKVSTYLPDFREELRVRVEWSIDQEPSGINILRSKTTRIHGGLCEAQILKIIQFQNRVYYNKQSHICLPCKYF